MRAFELRSSSLRNHPSAQFASRYPIKLDNLGEWSCRDWLRSLSRLATALTQSPLNLYSLMQSMSLPPERLIAFDEDLRNARCALRRDNDDPSDASDLTIKGPSSQHQDHLTPSSTFGPSTGAPRSWQRVRFLDNESG